MYTLKLNTPILPFVKFPLTNSKYIQDFLNQYEADKDKITKVIGVHFSHSEKPTTSVGIEITIIKSNDSIILESNNNRRYQVIDYNKKSNFSNCLLYED
jgi:hypothetical protein